MDEKPDNTKPCWYQFSLRTLLIGVALLSVVSGAGSYGLRQANIVAARKAFLVSHDTMCTVAVPHVEPPLIRRLLRDKLYTQVALRSTATESERAEAAALFPEAEICAINPTFPWSSIGGSPGENQMFIPFPSSAR